MSCNIVVYTSDDRQKSIARHLPGRKAEGICEKPDVVILPTPLRTLEKPLEFNSKPIVFAGKIEEPWRQFFIDNEMNYVDMMKDETVAERNAQVTAEATLALLITRGGYSFQNEKYMLAGYGRCGRAIARRLLAWGAKVTVLARSREARKMAMLDGCNSVPFSYGPKEAYGTRAVINTVPAKVIGAEIINELQQDCVIIDIASICGCDTELIHKKGISFSHELGLPGRFLTGTSGQILAECVLSYLRSQHKLDEGMPWIYQIEV